MRKLILLMTLLMCHSFFARTIDLSPDAAISLLTCSPGNVNFNAYGHSAIRVNDPKNGLDLVYNYGTFDNDIEDFELKFARGLVQYSLEIESFPRFKANYDYYNRSIYEQTFNLNPDQKQELFDFLNENALEENKYYWYDFIFNNCSSVIRDIMTDITGAEFPQEKSKQSFRDMIDFYNDKGEWNDLGIDILLGSKIDRKAKGFETMFLPDYLMEEFGKAQIDGRPLVSKTETILDNGYEFYREEGWMAWLRPAPLFWAVLLLLFLYKIYSKDRFPPFFSVLFLTVLGLAGWLLIFMWFGTRHDATKLNLNILWAFPLNFPMALFLLSRKIPNWVVKYFHFVRVVLISLLFVWPFFPQDFHIAILPIILIALLAISSNIPVDLNRRGSESIV